MSLLPSLFRQTDIPMQLGAKVVPPAPKKPDPIKDFETWDWTQRVDVGVDHAAGQDMFVVARRGAIQMTGRTTFTDVASGHPSSIAKLQALYDKTKLPDEWIKGDCVVVPSDAQPMDASLKKDLIDMLNLAAQYGIRCNRSALVAAGVIPPGTLGTLTTGQATRTVDWLLAKIEDAQRSASAELTKQYRKMVKG